jgi:hypothetical protein
MTKKIKCNFVKDYRGARDREKQVISELPNTIAQKVVGTLATIVSGCRDQNESEKWKHYENLINQPLKKVKIIFWCEFNPPNPNQRKLNQKISNLNQEIKKVFPG